MAGFLTAVAVLDLRGEVDGAQQIERSRVTATLRPSSIAVFALHSLYFTVFRRTTFPA